MSHTETSIASTAIYDRLFDESMGHPQDRAALIDAENPNRFFTLNDLKSKIRIFARNINLIWPALKEGDVVVQCSPNDIDLVVSSQGFVYTGTTVAIIDHTRNEEGAIARDIRTSSAKYIVTHPKILEKVLTAAEELGIPKGNILVCGSKSVQGIRCLSVLFEGDKVDHETRAIARRNIRDPAYLLYTSGTTGVSKAVKLSYQSILHLFDNQVARDGYNGDSLQKCISFSQFYHGSGAMLTLIMAILNATTTYIMEKFDLQKFCIFVERYKCTTTFMLPYAASCTVRDPISKNYDLSSLKNVIVLGERPNPTLVDSFKERFGVEVLDMYGMTETFAPFESKLEYSKKGAIGKLINGIQAKLIDDDGSEGKVGELRIKGPNVTPGYYNNEEANKAAFDDKGFFCTGDIFKVDDEGVYSFISRKKEMIKIGAQQIDPGEVEKIVLQAPNVAQCAVVGIYDNRECRQLLTAFVERTKSDENSKADEKTLTSIAQGVMDHVNALINSHKTDDYFRLHGGVLIVDSLPRNTLGKTVRAKLRENPVTFRHAYYQ